MRIHFYSLHGLFRAENLEIGRDADNGGQIVYVMELARALSERPEVTQVHLFTRRMDDPAVGPDYAVPVERVNDKFDIRRVACGGRRYLLKEALWDHHDEYVTNVLAHIKSEKLFPDWIHSHYADAGYVARELSAILNVPFAHSAHSLGKPKLEKLLAAGLPEAEALQRFRFAERFAAEEGTLANAEFIVTSTELEVRSHAAYANAGLAEYHVIPPGIDASRYYPFFQDFAPGAAPSEARGHTVFLIRDSLEKFFSHPERPIILAICRPDRKKNLDGLIHAYGTDRELQAIANLAIFAGIREDIAAMPPGEKEVLTEILLLMDKYNLYGRLAIPKKHESRTQVPEIYRLCAQKKGVFVNMALTEPFGLTILEAAACGLPVVATNEGGPAEIVQKCGNGLLADPQDLGSIQRALKQMLTDPELWLRCSETGVRRVRENYSWEVHVERYLHLVNENRQVSQGRGRKNIALNPKLHERLKLADRMIVSDIDGTLISETGDDTGLEELRARLQARGHRFAFALASGRSLEKVREVVGTHALPTPDIVISSVGTHIYYGLEARSLDKGWLAHIDRHWEPDAIRERLAGLPGLELQEETNQNPFKISYYLQDRTLDVPRISDALGRLADDVTVLVTQAAFLDLLPKRASKGRAIRYLARKWSIPLSQVVVCGDAGNDLDMFTVAAKGIVVGNHAPELEVLRGVRRVYFAQARSAAGILEGLEHFEFDTIPETPSS